jgi:hypothetical protein
MTYLLGAFFSAILYRLGGAGKEEIVFAHPKFRDWGCPLTVILTFVSLGHWHWTLLIYFVLAWGALSTYFTPKSMADVQWWGFGLHGLAIGLSLLPYGVSMNIPGQVVAYAYMLGAFMALWSAICKNVWWEECGRGAFIVLLLIIFS